ncbi:hypothetical protein BGY98DRAFT_935123, partial [Russula aff. rugulosa BPL654]
MSRAHSSSSNSNGKRKGKAALGNDHALFEHSDWLHIAQHRSVHRTSGLWSSRYRTHSTSPNTTIIPPSAKHASSGVWKGKDVRHFSCQTQAVRYSDTGQTNHIPPSTIVDRFVNGEPLPNSSQLVDIKTAWSAFMELRKRPVPPQHSVVLAFVDRALSTVEGTLVHGENTRELVRWSARLRRALKQLGDIEHLPPDESAHVSCLLTRIHALLGRFDDVASSFPRTWNHPTNEENLDSPEFRMVETVLQALFRYRGPVAVLDFIVSQWYSLAVIADMRGKSGKVISRTGSLLIRFLIRRRVPEDALAVYREMQRQSVNIAPLLKLWLVRALVSGHAFEQANTLFSEISASVPSGRESELFLATALHLFSSQGNVTRSEAAFKILEDRNLDNYRVIGLRLLAHARNGDVETVLRYFHHYFPPNAEIGDRPDIFHYTAVLMAHAKACDSSGLNKWFGKMIADGLEPDRHVYNILIDDCLRRGMFEDAASIIKEMRIRQLPPLAETYTTIIAALAKRGDPVMAEAYYKQALREGVKPDRQMVATLMTAHSTA